MFAPSAVLFLSHSLREIFFASDKRLHDSNYTHSTLTQPSVDGILNIHLNSRRQAADVQTVGDGWLQGDGLFFVFLSCILLFTINSIDQQQT